MTRRIFIDVTRTARGKTHTGIQKVVRSIYRSLKREADAATEVIPVVIQRSGAYPIGALPEHPYELSVTGKGRGPSLAKRGTRTLSAHLRAHWIERIQPLAAKHRARPPMTALRWTVRRAFAARRLIESGIATFRRGRPVRFRAGDVLLLPDSGWSTDPWPVVQRAKRAGAEVVAIWYDVIPVTQPHFFPPSLVGAFRTYLTQTLTHADRIICISRTVQAEIELQASAIGASPRIHHLYPIVSLAGPATEARPDMVDVFDSRPSLLILATIEPRKGHALLLEACERLWAQGNDFNLVVIGRVGWQVGELMHRLRRHEERGSRLFLYHDATDAEVAYALRRALLMVFPSQAEGLGLPILEAAMAGCPTLCSDIPVFREIATPETRFFAPYSVDGLARALGELLASGEPQRLRGILEARKLPDRSAAYARELLALLGADESVEARSEEWSGPIGSALQS
jgi:alpha-1,2-rhamnosyltransferase